MDSIQGSGHFLMPKNLGWLVALLLAGLVIQLLGGYQVLLTSRMCEHDLGRRETDLALPRHGWVPMVPLQRDLLD